MEEGAQGPSRAVTDGLPLAVYEQLKAIARVRMAGERSGHTLQTTALVHEAYLRLTSAGTIDANDKTRFFRAAAEAMRQVLIDHARTRGRAKRGGKARRELVDVVDLAVDDRSVEILALDEAICRLEQQSPDAASVVRLRFYAGLTVEETAQTLDFSPRTVNRLWTFARAWLWRELETDGED